MGTRIHYELPDQIHRRAKMTAGHLGVSLKEYVETALEEKSQRHKSDLERNPPSPYKRR